MSRTTWKQLVVAAVLVLIAGVALVAAAEEQHVEVRVENDGQEVNVDINGVAGVVGIDDLAEGESRTFNTGDHEIVVTRLGDELTVTTEGLAIPDLGDDPNLQDVMVWVGDDGENLEVRKEKVIVVKGDGTTSQHAYTYHITGDGEMTEGDMKVDIEEILGEEGGDGHSMVFIDRGDGEEHPMVVKRIADDMVTYRCEETGSVLRVKKDDAIEDVYICPATGCVMKKVDEPEVKMIKVKVASDED